MLCLQTNAVVTRDQFQILPMPKTVIAFINARAKKEGFLRGLDPALTVNKDGEINMDATTAPTLPEMMPIDERADIIPSAEKIIEQELGVDRLAVEIEFADTHTESNVDVPHIEDTTPPQLPDVFKEDAERGVRRSSRQARARTNTAYYTFLSNECDCENTITEKCIRKELASRV